MGDQGELDQDEFAGADEVELADIAPPSKRFVSEKELDEIRKTREDQGLAADKEYDPEASRPLYERLKEQREKEESEWKAAHGLPVPKALDEDEISFLSALDKEEERRRREFSNEIEQEIERAKKERLQTVFKADEIVPPPLPVPAAANFTHSSSASASAARSSVTLDLAPAAAALPLVGATFTPKLRIVAKDKPRRIKRASAASSAASGTGAGGKKAKTESQGPSQSAPSSAAPAFSLVSYDALSDNDC